MKVYTGTGDGGKTSLFSGERLVKSDIRIAAYGTVDELNSLVGVIGALLAKGDAEDRIRRELYHIQGDLFTLGAWLATTVDSPMAEQLKPVQKTWGDKLEEQIDTMQAELEELRSFILPGGHQAAAMAHVARTVCRRAEREIVATVEGHGTFDENYKNLLVYINRLSDYFFVLARYCNHITNTPETLWHG